MRKAILVALIFCFVGSLAYGVDTATLSVLNGRLTPPVTPDAFEQSCVLLCQADVLTAPPFPWRVLWSPHISAGGTEEEKLAAGEGRVELMQSFEITPGGADANMGGYAVQVNYDTTKTEANDVAVKSCAGTTLVLSLYQLREFMDKPHDRNLVAQWECAIPAGTDTIAGNNSTARRGAWLKFIFNTGYHLKAGVPYGMRLGWKSIQPGDPNWYEARQLTLLGVASTAVYPPGAYDPGGPGGRENHYGYNYRWNRFAEGPFELGVLWHYDDVRRPPSMAYSATAGPFWCQRNRDMNFAVIRATAGQPVNMGNLPGDSVSLPAGDVSMDGRDRMDDLAAMAANWRMTDRRTLSDNNIPFIADNTPPPAVKVAINDQPTPSDPCLTPWTELTRTVGKAAVFPFPAIPARCYHVGQSFKATANGTVGGISIQIASDFNNPISGSTCGKYTIKVYSLANTDTLPQNGTLLKTFKGEWVDYNAAYPPWPYVGDYVLAYQKKIGEGLVQNIYYGDWLTFIMPSGVDVTANNYYAFTLSWDDNVNPIDTYYGPSNYVDRKFFIDCSTPGGTDVYTDGRAFYQDNETAYANGTWAHFDSSQEIDLDFAVLLGKKYVCSANTYNNVGFRRVVGDLNEDCSVDMKDLAVLVSDWLDDNVN